MESRNRTRGFASRTRKNLFFIEKAFSQGEDVHVVTQLSLSLLGLVVIPRERQTLMQVSDIDLRDLAKQGWPSWNFVTGTQETLGELLRHLRNGIAHGYIAFTSESRILEEVAIHIWDRKPSEIIPSWYVTMRCPEVRDFCLRLADLIEDEPY